MQQQPKEECALLKRLGLTGLWRHANFVKLWIGSTISLFGSQITFIALPVTAILLLHATSAQMGILVAAGTIPNLLGGLFAGVWVDRLRRRPLLISMDIGRAVLLGSIPIAAFLGILHIEYLYVDAFLVGCLNLFFNVAYQAFLPTVIEREQLIEGNSKLQASSSIADFAGPGLAGILVQLITAPFAIAFDALSFLVSAVSISSLRVQEEKPVFDKGRSHFWHALIEGLRFTFRNQTLRSLVAVTGVLNFTGGVFNTLLMLYFLRDLKSGIALYGLVFTVGSISGILASLITSYITKKFGVARIAVVSALIIAVGWLLVPLIKNPAPLVFSLIFIGALLAGAGNTMYNITISTLAQTITPVGLLGRVKSVFILIGQGMLPLGALLGGFLGDISGFRSTLLAAGSIRFLLFLIFLMPLFRNSAEVSKVSQYEISAPER